MPRRPSMARSRPGAPSSMQRRGCRSPLGLGSDVPFFLASGGPALVEGRGELVAPLHGLHGAPGVLLVTPAVAVPTGDVFAAFDAIRGHGDPSVRLSSTHLAEELRSKMSASDLVARAGALAMANDLLPATALVVPALVPFRRALSRLLRRPSECQVRARRSGHSILRVPRRGGGRGRPRGTLDRDDHAAGRRRPDRHRHHDRPAPRPASARRQP